MSAKRNRETAGSVDSDGDEIPEFQPGKGKTSADECRNMEGELLPPATQPDNKIDRELGSIITRFSSLDGQHLGNKVGTWLVVLLRFFCWLQFFLSLIIYCLALCTTVDRCATEINSCTIGGTCKCTSRSRGR